MIVVVDTNEQATSPQTVDSIKKHFKNVVIANISSDIQIPLDDGSVLAIERKAANGFLASIADRRIFEQLERMASEAKYSAIVVTGQISYDQNDMVRADGRQTGWNGESVRSVFYLIQFSGCALVWCPAEEFPLMVEEIYNTVNKPDKRQGIRQRRIITFPPLDLRVELLAQFPNVGLKRSESLLSHPLIADGNDYGTLASALELGTVMATVDKDSRPEGWGPKTILGFRKMLGLESNQYLKIETEE